MLLLHPSSWFHPTLHRKPRVSLHFTNRVAVKAHNELNIDCGEPVCCLPLLCKATKSQSADSLRNLAHIALWTRLRDDPLMNEEPRHYYSNGEPNDDVHRETDEILPDEKKGEGSSDAIA